MTYTTDPGIRGKRLWYMYWVALSLYINLVTLFEELTYIDKKAIER